MIVRFFSVLLLTIELLATQMPLYCVNGWYTMWMMCHVQCINWWQTAKADERQPPLRCDAAFKRHHIDKSTLINTTMSFIFHEMLLWNTFLHRNTIELMNLDLCMLAVYYVENEQKAINTQINSKNTRHELSRLKRPKWEVWVNGIALFIEPWLCSTIVYL